MEKSVVLREIDTRGIITKTKLPVGDYAVNPYVGCTHGCRYCYASFMKRFTHHKEEWGSFLDVKYWPDFNLGKYEGKELFFGSVTDPYLPEEKEYERTRSLLKSLKGIDLKISIQTKSDLVLRDLDLLKSFRNVRVGFSINTLDEAFKRDMDDAPSISRRLDAMRVLFDEGIRTTCFISPIFPVLTDVIGIIERVKGICNLVWLENLNLSDGAVRRRIISYIGEKHPSLLPLYEEIYQEGNLSYWEELDGKVKEYAGKEDFEYVRNDDKVDSDGTLRIVDFFFHERIRRR